MWFQKNNNAFNLNNKQQIVYTWHMTWRWIEQLIVNPTGQFKNSLLAKLPSHRVNWFELCVILHTYKVRNDEKYVSKKSVGCNFN